MIQVSFIDIVFGPKFLCRSGTRRVSYRAQNSVDALGWITGMGAATLPFPTEELCVHTGTLPLG